MVSFEEKLNLLEENWGKIRSKVIFPLWNRKFKTMYLSAKMDYDDFESLAGLELSRAMTSFDPDKSNIFTYATRVVNKKAMTELRNCTQRDKRRVLHISESVDALDRSFVENVYCSTNDDTFSDSDSSKDDLSMKMQSYLNKLSNLQKDILFAISEGYTNEEIIARFKITPKEMTEAYCAIRSYRNVSILF